MDLFFILLRYLSYHCKDRTIEMVKCPRRKLKQNFGGIEHSFRFWKEKKAQEKKKTKNEKIILLKM